MIGSVQGGQDAGRAIDLLEVAEVVPGSQVHAPALVYPAVCLESGQEDHGIREGRADLEHRTVLLRKVPEERVQVAVSTMRVQQQLGQRNRRNLPGKGGTSKGWAGEVLRDRRGQGAADQVHLADELDALLRLVVELEYETKDVAGIDEADNDDISRIGNLVGKNRLHDTQLYKLTCRIFYSVAGQFRLPDRLSQCPEFTVVIFQNLQVNQAVQNRINDRFRTGSEPVRSSTARSVEQIRLRFLSEWDPDRGSPVSDSSTRNRDSMSVSMRDLSESSASTAPTTAQFKCQPGTW